MKYDCPCSIYFTLSKPVRETLADICPVCFWEDEFLLFRDDELSTSNGGMTLIEGRKIIKLMALVRKKFVQYVRAPLGDELGDETIREKET